MFKIKVNYHRLTLIFFAKMLRFFHNNILEMADVVTKAAALKRTETNTTVACLRSIVRKYLQIQLKRQISRPKRKWRNDMDHYWLD